MTVARSPAYSTASPLPSRITRNHFPGAPRVTSTLGLRWWAARYPCVRIATSPSHANGRSPVPSPRGQHTTLATVFRHAACTSAPSIGLHHAAKAGRDKRGLSRSRRPPGFSRSGRATSHPAGLCRQKEGGSTFGASHIQRPRRSPWMPRFVGGCAPRCVSPCLRFPHRSRSGRDSAGDLEPNRRASQPLQAVSRRGPPRRAGPTIFARLIQSGRREILAKPSFVPAPEIVSARTTGRIHGKVRNSRWIRAACFGRIPLMEPVKGRCRLGGDHAQRQNHLILMRCGSCVLPTRQSRADPRQM